MAKNRKSEVNGTELRQNLPTYLAEVKKGREIEVTSRGRVIEPDHSLVSPLAILMIFLWRRRVTTPPFARGIVLTPGRGYAYGINLRRRLIM